MDKKVCLVIPARNAARTIHRCLECAVTILERGELQRIIVVDDGSTDNTAELAEKFPVTCIRSQPRGRSAARNLGWRAAAEEFIWFLDADCVPEPDALAKLLAGYDPPAVGGVGGSFTMPPGAPLLAGLIHQEITERHRAMGRRVDFVATGNASYRREVLEWVNGFDEAFLRAQDAELSYRVRAAGYELAFARDSRVRHFHDTKLAPYLRAQAQQGYWRVWLHLRHASHAVGDSYSGILDNAQPPMAVLLVVSLLLLLLPGARLVVPALAALLVMLPLPMTLRLVRRTGQWRYLWYAPMSIVRAFARGLGLSWGVVSCMIAGRSKFAHAQGVE